MKDEDRDWIQRKLDRLAGVISKRSLDDAKTSVVAFFSMIAELKAGDTLLTPLHNVQIDIDYRNFNGERDMLYILHLMQRKEYITISRVWKYPNGNRKINEFIDLLKGRGQFKYVVDEGAQNEYVNLRIPGEHVERVKELLGDEFDLRNFKL